MPKPNATTEACSRNRVNVPADGNGCVKLSPKAIPSVSAIGGEISPLAERTNAKRKTILIAALPLLPSAMSSVGMN